ncbi:MAG: DUF1579 family protein [Phycisphaerales bacterium]
MTRTLNHILLSILLSTLHCGLVTTAAAFAHPATPSEDEARHLDFLQWEVGRWSTDITMYTAPDQPPARFKGRQVDRMSGCGWWLVTDLSMVAGDDGAAAPPYEGHGVLGWDPVKEKLVGIWVDSSRTWLATAEGTVDESGDVLTLRIQDRHPQSGEPMVTIFQTTRIDADTRQLDVFIEDASGEHIPVGRILSTRLSDGATTRPSQ